MGRLRRSRAILVALLVMASLFVTGCWSEKEISSLAIVVGMGIDLGADGLVRVSAQIARPLALSGGGSGAGGTAQPQQKPFYVVSAEGRTLFEATRMLSRQSPRRLFWSHSRVLALGEEAARAGVRPYLDFLLRNGEPRMVMTVLTVKGGTAMNLLESEFELESLPAEGLAKLLGQKAPGKSLATAANVSEFVVCLEEEGVDPMTGLVEMIPKTATPPEGGGSTAGAGELDAKAIPWSPAVEGAAVYRDDKLVGWLGVAEARGAMWAKGGAENAAVVVRPNPAAGDVSLWITGAKAKMRAEMVQGQAVVKIALEISAAVGDIAGEADFLSDPGLVPSLEERLSVAVAGEVEAALARSREYRSDFMGIGSAIHRSLPKEWHKLRADWGSQLAGVKVEVSVKAQISHMGKTTRTVRPG